jgi:hypothetical protein
VTDFITDPQGGALLFLLFAVTTERWYSGGVRTAVTTLLVLVSLYIIIGVSVSN